MEELGNEAGTVALFMLIGWLGKKLPYNDSTHVFWERAHHSMVFWLHYWKLSEGGILAISVMSSC